MKKTVLTISLCACAVLFLSFHGSAQDSGKAGSVVRNAKEIVVAYADPSRPLKAGQRLYCSAGAESYTIIVVVPMEKYAKCRIISSTGREISSIPAGMDAAFEPQNRNRKPSRGKPGEVKTVGGVEFVYIPGGTFTMGVNTVKETYYLGEGVPHKVTVSPFWISRYEITQKQYADIMNSYPSPYRDDEVAVENVNWKDAMDFGEKFGRAHGVNARIPYEAEWEFAGRGGATTNYYWGNEINGDYCWYGINSGGKAHKGGLKKPNAFGLYDMSGNVCEWVQDWLGMDYYSKSPAVDPRGPSSGEKKILRGGSYVNGSSHPSPMRVDIRIQDYPTVKKEGWGAFGIRLVLTD
jgi:formylglycine-generating enzyme required for sulfatase activity